MRIVQLAAGAGPMYCGSCLHGNTLATAMRKLGEDVVLVPVYTPIRTDEESVSIQRLAMGGINVYLQERSALFRRTPDLIARWLDHPSLVRWAARRGTRTRPERLGALTLAVLHGNEGRLRKEVAKLVHWLKSDLRPDVVHLSNVLLAGLARPLREQLGVPVVCTLSGEDGFLERLPSPWCEEARNVLRGRAEDLSALVALNDYYADFMAEYLAVPCERIHVIRPGLNLDGYPTPAETDAAAEPLSAAKQSTVKTIGFLSRVCPEKGLHLLAEAMRRLAQSEGVPPARLRVAGYLDEADRPYLVEIQQQFTEWGLADRFEYVGELDRQSKIAFLRSLDVMCLPTVCRESKGLPVLEAWANAVPVVLSAHGAFPEMVEDTGGGLLCEPENAAALADALTRMLLEPEFAARCGRQAQRAVYDRYYAERMARQTLDLYKSLCNRS